MSYTIFQYSIHPNMSINIDEEELRCPITRQIMKEPVVASDGHIYEKEFIEEWLKVSKLSPITKQEIENKFYDVYIIKNKIAKYLDNNPDKINEQYQHIEHSEKKIRDLHQFCNTLQNK